MIDNNWIQTYTGKKFFPLKPTEDSVCIEDIAHALSMTCRYSGHCSNFYSVAEHSLLVARFVPKKLKLTALLHDASEAYITDVPRPIKPFLSNYKQLESEIEKVIAKKFNTVYPFPPEVKSIDDRILSDEKKLIMVDNPDVIWTLFGEPLGIKKIRSMPPKTAEKEFLKTYYKFIS